MANNRLPFGLCEKYRIELPDNATPRDAWDALRGLIREYGYNPDNLSDEWITLILNDDIKTPRKEITAITDKAIERVPLVIVPEYSYEECKFIQEQHKALLKFARDENNNNEVAFAFRKDFSERVVIKGTDDSIDFRSTLDSKGDGLFLMHNHPRNSSFSLNDVMYFVENTNLRTLSVVKNNGRVEVLLKTDAFDIIKAKNTLLRELKNHQKKCDDRVNSMVIEKFLIKSKETVIWMK